MHNCINPVLSVSLCPWSTAAIMVSSKRAGLLDRKKVEKKLCQYWYIAVITALFMTDTEGTWNSVRRASELNSTEEIPLLSFQLLPIASLL